MAIEYKVTTVPILWASTWSTEEALGAMLEREWKEGAWELVGQVDKWRANCSSPQSVLVFKRGK